MTGSEICEQTHRSAGAALPQVSAVYITACAGIDSALLGLFVKTDVSILLSCVHQIMTLGTLL